MKKRANIFEQSVFVGFSLKKKISGLAFLFVLFHTIKDFFQDFLETDFLYFVDANENLMAFPQWGRWGLAVANDAAAWIGILLVFITPLVFWKKFPRLENLLVIGYLFFVLTLGIDLLLDPRIAHPQSFFNKSTRIPASQVKKNYSEILRQGPF